MLRADYVSRMRCSGLKPCHSVLTNHDLFWRSESIFGVKGHYNVAWRRPQRKRTLPGMASEGEDTLPPLTATATGGEPEQAGSTTGGDGLGESTAPSPKTKAKAKETAGA